jgi:hypothetical protein
MGRASSSSFKSNGNEPSRVFESSRELDWKSKDPKTRKTLSTSIKPQIKTSFTNCEAASYAEGERKLQANFRFFHKLLGWPIKTDVTYYEHVTLAFPFRCLVFSEGNWERPWRMDKRALAASTGGVFDRVDANRAVGIADGLGDELRREGGRTNHRPHTAKAVCR